ncbi:hypothetical protein [uncultured Pontibacter sp.]|uniref:hypothetical protein n=1 Tax=uncultured Pontibacter sp. TaxID=453356 RepID=UPI00260FF520|nr:hypothetical protein [uncultured Pontibacter sp.]
MKNRLTILLIALLLFGCQEETEQKEASASKPTSAVQPDLLNISIILDLSDRVVQPMQPSQSERDIQVVNKITEIFKNNMKAKGAFQAKDKIRVLFTPAPKDPNINSIASSLSVDLTKLDNKGKKDVYDNITTTFTQGLEEIYAQAIRTKNWSGSDIWRFFKYDAKELCVDPNPQYRNVLVIVTDGYLYHSQSKDRQENKTAFITANFFQKEGFRDNSNWKEKFEKENYGLIASEQSYENLDVLVLEINPSPAHRNDEDIIRAYLGKWFDEMKVGNKVLYNTDLPSNTEKRIESFFRSK